MPDRLFFLLFILPIAKKKKLSPFRNLVLTWKLNFWDSCFLFPFFLFFITFYFLEERLRETSLSYRCEDWCAVLADRRNLTVNLQRSLTSPLLSKTRAIKHERVGGRRRRKKKKRWGGHGPWRDKERRGIKEAFYESLQAQLSPRRRYKKTFLSPWVFLFLRRPRPHFCTRPYLLKLLMRFGDGGGYFFSLMCVFSACTGTDGCNN